jgi:hypothetical protein
MHYRGVEEVEGAVLSPELCQRVEEQNRQQKNVPELPIAFHARKRVVIFLFFAWFLRASLNKLEISCPYDADKASFIRHISWRT